MKYSLSVLANAAALWYQSGSSHSAAAVAYYALFAAAPLLFFTISISSLLYGEDVIVATLFNWGSILGDDLLHLLQRSVQNVETVNHASVLPLVAAAFLSFMIVVFLNAHTTGLHAIFKVQESSFFDWLRKSFHSITFIVVLEAYFLFLFGLVILPHYIMSIPHNFIVTIFEATFFLLATAALFSLSYGILSFKKLTFFSRLVGGIVAGTLFTVAKYLVAAYVATTPVPGLFGAAGLVIVLLIWLYVSSGIIYYGAAVAAVVERDS